MYVSGFTVAPISHRRRQRSLGGGLPEELLHHSIGDGHFLRLWAGLRLSKLVAPAEAMLLQELLVELLANPCLLGQYITLLLQLGNSLVGLFQVTDQLLLVVIPAVGLIQLLLNDVLGLGEVLQPALERQDLVILPGELLLEPTGGQVGLLRLVAAHASPFGGRGLLSPPVLL